MNPLILIILVLLGIGIGYVIRTRQIMLRDTLQGPTSRFTPLKYALVAGGLGGLFFLSAMIILGLGDPTYIWSPEHVLGIAVFALAAFFFVGLVTLIGMTWSFFVLGKYRDFLYPRLVKPQRPDQSTKNTSGKPKS